MPHWETQRRIDGWGLLGLFFSDALCMFQEDILGWNTWDFLWRFSWFVSFLLIHGFWYKWSQKHLSRVSHMVSLYVHASLVRQSITVCDPLGTKYSCVLGSWTSLFMTFVNQKSLNLFPLFTLPTPSCLDQEEKYALEDFIHFITVTIFSCYVLGFSIMNLLPVNLTRKQKNNPQIPALAPARCNFLAVIYSLFNDQSFPKKTTAKLSYSSKGFFMTDSIIIWYVYIWFLHTLCVGMALLRAIGDLHAFWYEEED